MPSTQPMPSDGEEIVSDPDGQEALFRADR
jgi:hypothetical protein